MNGLITIRGGATDDSSDYESEYSSPGGGNRGELLLRQVCQVQCQARLSGKALAGHRGKKEG
jgi:hypothetical protein